MSGTPIYEVTVRATLTRKLRIPAVDSDAAEEQALRVFDAEFIEWVPDQLLGMEYDVDCEGTDEREVGDAEPDE